MRIGTFLMPINPPERSIRESHEWNLRHITLCDQMGFEEAWIGEHFTVPWEPGPAPDLMIAQALTQTRYIKLATGGHCLPYHHPVGLAHRIAYLDQISEGRIMFGVAGGTIPTDRSMFDVTGGGKVNREKMQESLTIILKLWTEDGPWEYHGEYWQVSKPADAVDGLLRYYFQPYQKPHPPISIAGTNKNSPTLEFAGEQGLNPMSFALSFHHLKSHWESVLRGAEKTGRSPQRDEWRIAAPIVVAETDKKARKLVVDGPIGRCYREFLLPVYHASGQLTSFKQDPDMADSDVTVEYLVDNTWLVGSVDTVADKIARVIDESGGFGVLNAMTFDHHDCELDWLESLRLLVEEVAPKFA